VTRNQKPSVFQLGEVREEDGVTVVAGWGLGMCAPQCRCHRDPADGQLQILEDHAAGTLGLRSFGADGDCDCCEPWTSAELCAVLRDAAAVEALECQEPAAG
jgi:hypothetical protein